MTSARLVALLLATIAAGCGSNKPDDCAAYAERDFACGGYPESEKAITLKLAEGFCREVLAGNPELQSMTSVKAGPGCVKSTKTCDEYKACIAAAEAAAPR